MRRAGLELAGEIAHDFGIKVTLVHSTQHLFDMGPKVHNACMKAARSVPSLEVQTPALPPRPPQAPRARLTLRAPQIVLGERARQAEVLEAQTPFDVTAESGRVFHCVDMVVHAFGAAPPRLTAPPPHPRLPPAHRSPARAWPRR